MTTIVVIAIGAGAIVLAAGWAWMRRRRQTDAAKLVHPSTPVAPSAGHSAARSHHRAGK